MNKILIAATGVIVVASAVVIINHNLNNNTVKENNTKQEINLNKDVKVDKDYVSCTDICAKKMLDSCSRVKGNLKNCEANCDTWTNSMKSCVKQATNCEQLDLDFSRTAEDISREAKGMPVTAEDKIRQTSHCTIVDDDYSDVSKKEPEKEIQYGCSSACYKYKQCAGFAEDITEAEKNEAYDSCFEQCQNWSKTTLTCMKKVNINSPADCAPLTMCGLSEYNH